MRNIKLIIEYEGTHYRGWQSQINGPTVQDTLEAALSRILNRKVRVNGSGRTDSGVHALAQVANFKTDSSLRLSALQRGANSLLPSDILIKTVSEEAEDFHARFHAKSRIYEYRIWNAPLPSVFQRQYSWWIREPLDRGGMEEASGHLIGRHDFSSFQGADHQKVSPEKEVLRAEFRPEGAALIFFIQANAFLRHMVRNIMGTLVAVGKGEISPDDLRRILAARDRGQAGITAPARGLFLNSVLY